jgi:hypothetical protein
VSSRGYSDQLWVFHVRLVFESSGWNARCALTTLRNGAICAEGTQTPLTAVPQKTVNGRPAGDQHERQIVTFSSHGDTKLLEYDPATADMEEVNKVIAEYEAKTGAQPFDMATGERIEKVTRQQNEVLMVHPIAGG